MTVRAETRPRPVGGAARIAALFDCPVSVALRDPRLDWPVAAPQEEAAIARARGPRRRAFRAGRHALREALSSFGPPCPVPVGAGGAPVWPAGLSGSLSHCRTACAAVVASERDAIALGLDVEEAEPLPRELWEAVCTPAERAALARAAAPGLEAKRIFCGKEAVYKAQYALSGQMLNFQDLELALHADGAGFEARFLRHAPPFTKGTRLAGRLALAEGLVWAGVTLLSPRWRAA